MKGLTTFAAGLRRPAALLPRLNARQLFLRTAFTQPDRVDFQAIDTKWRQRWADAARNASANALANRPKAYVLSMFPYPSGILHLGHLRVYTISDVLARFKHMQGYDVIHPMGWDAFGLPAENAAIERGIDPAEWTVSNVAKMKEQFGGMNGRWDWDRELMTCDPSFYKHTQRLFLLLHERGLAYQEKSLVNWDPVEKTVLANEQVDANGKSWRSGAKVEQIYLKQWFLRITDFKEDLLNDLDLLAKDDRWPERVLSMQRNWLGKSKGSKLNFQIKASPDAKSLADVEVFTTRADTLFGVQYVALSLRHPLVQELANTNASLKTFLEEANGLPPDSKDGFLLPDVYAINPASEFATPDTKVQDPLPVYVAPYVLDDYGSGAVMGVPGHDTRDFAFWKKNQGSKPVITVVAPESTKSPSVREGEAFVHKGKLTKACGPFKDLDSDTAINRIVAELCSKGHDAEHVDNWRLRDWLISRQRYWGTPIPIIHCNSCGPVPVPESDLPVELPKLKSGQMLGRGGNPLADIPEFVNTTCPKCKSPATRETDTMDTFMDSSWYFFRFADPHNKKQLIDPKVADARLPVDVYIGGVEHAILHLLYARFISKFLSTTPLWPSGGGKDNKGEPFRKLITQGMVHGKTYTDPETGRFLKPEEVDISNKSSPVIKATKKTANVSFEKMSKSKYNGVDPGECIAKYGADVTRAHMLFQAPVTEVLEWDEAKITGIQRWLQRVWRVTSYAIEMTTPDSFQNNKLKDVPTADDITLALHQTIKSVNTSLSSTYSLNTVVSDLTKLTNFLDEMHAKALMDQRIEIQAARIYFNQAYRRGVKVLLTMLAPVCPAFAEECWEMLHRAIIAEQHSSTLPPDAAAAVAAEATIPSVFDQPFPEHSDELIHMLSNRDMVTAVQVNGKLAFTLNLPGPPDHLLDADASFGAFKPSPSEPDVLAATDAPAYDIPSKHFAKRPLERWLTAHIFASTQGRRGFGPHGRWDQLDPQKRIRQMVVVKGGRTVNFVLAKMTKKKVKDQVEAEVRRLEKEEREEAKALLEAQKKK
ncbi:Aminoacyl-tRNA synthetase class I conserved site [Lasiodiplodia theobromae]|uniref:leucine--tRNA ligase n=1 Tax=Lasiodiplodia theobromae TaxID=45133 RepID=A0A5N5DT44_9PEZI|nr:Leucine--tRNA ligase [Lasiodiplodia theobromae]KAF9629600.1 Aminoacyl-tRNA synthetase class I conserved site [Lasiodiplodia theobromae]